MSQPIGCGPASALTVAGRVAALAALLVGTSALGPAVHRGAAAPLPLLGARVARHAAGRPRTPLQPLALHCRRGTGGGTRRAAAAGESGGEKEKTSDS